MRSALAPGTRLGPYVIARSLGAGGMGAVYRATDTVLRRDVAVKVVEPGPPGESAAARLLREARRAAALNHPNICTVYHVGDTTEPPFIAMELVDGPTLHAAIQNGGLTAERACRIGRQIADALEHAHAHGIVHRDLKSTNVMLTATGQAKVVDFGIAAALPSDDQGAVTVTGPADHAVAGTVPYMAPEVLRGLAADVRSDLWSLGVVLFEMIAGRLPFSPTTSPDTVAAILRDPVPLLPPETPPALEHIVRRCLAKEPAERPARASEVAMALEVAALSTPLRSTIEATAAPNRSWRRWGMGLAAAVVLAAAAAGLQRMRPRALERDGLRLVNPQQVTRALGVEEHPAWSPDGRTLAYSASATGDYAAADWDVWVTQPGGTPINRTADAPGRAMFPAWSPDGSQIAFWSDRDGAGCYVMPALGGGARRVGAAGAFDPHAPIWSADGQSLACITGGPAELALTTVAVDTGQVTDRVPLPVQGRAMFLAASPNRQRMALVLAPAGLNADINQLVLFDRPTGRITPLSEGQTQIWSPTWSPDGLALHYVASDGGSADLWRQPFDAAGQAVGTAVALSSGIGMRNAALSVDGARVAYSQGRRVANVWRVPLLPDRPATWADAAQITVDQAYIEFADVSPDGRQLAVSSDRAGSFDLWVLPAAGGDMGRVTSDRGAEWAPRWSPDGTTFAFYASRSGNRDIWTLPTAGGAWSQLTTNPGADLLPSWSPNGREISHLSSRDGVGRVWVTPATGGDGREVATAASGGRWSPDGQTIAFIADGRVVQRSADGTGPITPLTAVGGSGFIWSKDGRNVYYGGALERRGNVYAVGADGRDDRPLTDLRGRRGSLVANSLATDGRYLYFSWQEDLGDLWVADLVR